MTPEGKVKKHVRAFLDRIGAYYIMPVSGGYGRHGIPDFVICYRGRFIGIETKAGKGKTTALQDRELASVVQAGGIALVINETNIHELEEIFNAPA